MNQLARFVDELWTDERAVSIPEFALLLSFLTLGTIAIVTTLTDAINAFFESTAEDMENM